MMLLYYNVAATDIQYNGIENPSISVVYVKILVVHGKKLCSSTTISAITKLSKANLTLRNWFTHTI